MLKKITKILLIISVGALISCAKRSPEPISTDIISKSAGEDLAKIKQIKEQNDLFNLGLKIDLYKFVKNKFLNSFAEEVLNLVE